jgi:hypothetical protein
MQFAAFCFACTESLFPAPTSSIFSYSSLFVTFISPFCCCVFCNSSFASPSLHSYTSHSSNSLSQPLEPLRFHNYNDTIVHNLHISFLTANSCRTQHINVVRWSPLSQQDQDSAQFHQSLVKRLKSSNSATFNPKQSHVVFLASPRLSTLRHQNLSAPVPTVAWYSSR